VNPSVERDSLEICKILDVCGGDEDAVLSDGMRSVEEVAGCSNEPDLELGSTDTDCSGKAELGEGRMDGEGSTATRDSVAVEVTIATVVTDDLLTVSGVAVISIIIDVVSGTSKISDSTDAVDSGERDVTADGSSRNTELLVNDGPSA
jgi:hypothetical protein